MLPIRHKSIFKSRWIALAWAAGIIWTAVDFAGQPKASADGNTASDNAPPVGNEDLAAAQVVVNELDGIK